MEKQSFENFVILSERLQIQVVVECPRNYRATKRRPPFKHSYSVVARFRPSSPGPKSFNHEICPRSVRFSVKFRYIIIAIGLQLPRLSSLSRCKSLQTARSVVGMLIEALLLHGSRG